MGGDLAIPVIVFLASAGSAIYFGGGLAKYGDALASLTGLGRLFVGSILVALATSLPELSTNIAAVRLTTPNPELAVGNIFGANMMNMFTLAVVALMFGGKAFLQRVSPEQGYLIVLAAVITATAVVFGAIKMDLAFWQIGLTSLILMAVYLAGMGLVYVTRPKQEQEDAEEHGVSISLSRAWLMFGLVSVGVIIAGFFLAWSTDRIAELTGVASSTMGILLVSLVTTMPEASATFFAARLGAADLGVSGLFGSCVFNITILSFADPFYREGILINQTELAHYVAGIVAVALLLAALVLILGRDRIGKVTAAVGLALMASAYIAAAALIAVLGTIEKGTSENPGGPSSHGPPTQSLAEIQGPWSDRPYRISAVLDVTGLGSGDNPL
jgi:cation:H+ antiporter